MRRSQTEDLVHRQLAGSHFPQPAEEALEDSDAWVLRELSVGNTSARNKVDDKTLQPAHVNKATSEQISKSVPKADVGRALDPLFKRIRRGDLGSIVLARELVPPGDLRAIDAVSACLGSWNPAVRRAALDTLRVLGIRGDEFMVANIGACLQDQDARVRESAKNALLRLADFTSARILAEFLRTSTVDVVPILQVLERVAAPGDKVVISAVSSRVFGTLQPVRKAAFKTLKVVALPGDAIAITMFARLLTDPGVRDEARAVLTDFMEVDAPLPEELLLLFDCADEDTRVAATQALRKIASHGNAAALEKLETLAASKRSKHLQKEATLVLAASRSGTQQDHASPQHHRRERTTARSASEGDLRPDRTPFGDINDQASSQCDLAVAQTSTRRRKRDRIRERLNLVRKAWSI